MSQISPTVFCQDKSVIVRMKYCRLWWPSNSEEKKKKNWSRWFIHERLSYIAVMFVFCRCLNTIKMYKICNWNHTIGTGSDYFIIKYIGIVVVWPFKKTSIIPYPGDLWRTFGDNELQISMLMYLDHLQMIRFWLGYNLRLKVRSWWPVTYI